MAHGDGHVLVLTATGIPFNVTVSCIVFGCAQWGTHRIPLQLRSPIYDQCRELALNTISTGNVPQELRDIASSHPLGSTVTVR